MVENMCTFAINELLFFFRKMQKRDDNGISKGCLLPWLLHSVGQQIDRSLNQH